MAETINVKVEEHFEEWILESEAVIMKAIAETLVEAAQLAKAADTPYKYESKIVIIPPEKVDNGFAGAIGDNDWKANWFEKGTAAHSNRSRGTHSLTATGRKRRKASGLVSGVKAEHPLRRGVFGSKPFLVERLRSGLGGIRV